MLTKIKRTTLFLLWYRFQDNWKFNANFNYQKLESDNFKELKDLLGAKYAKNLDAYNGDSYWNLDNPDYKVYEGDRTQYSYMFTEILMH